MKLNTGQGGCFRFGGDPVLRVEVRVTNMEGRTLTFGGIAHFFMGS